MTMETSAGDTPKSLAMEDWVFFFKIKLALISSGVIRIVPFMN
jgi:hypothetical protein